LLFAISFIVQLFISFFKYDIPIGVNLLLRKTGYLAITVLVILAIGATATPNFLLDISNTHNGTIS